MTDRATQKRRNGNGGSSTHVREQVVEVQGRVDDLARSLGTMKKEARASLEQEMKARPYQAVSVAAIVGFVLGGGLSLAVLRTATSIGARLAVGALITRLTKQER